jgi:hypothetical protein
MDSEAHFDWKLMLPVMERLTQELCKSSESAPQKPTETTCKTVITPVTMTMSQIELADLCQGHIATKIQSYNEYEMKFHNTISVGSNEKSSNTPTLLMWLVGLLHHTQ